MNLYRKITPVLLILIALLFSGATVLTYSADARSMGGGKSFRSTPYKAPAQKSTPYKSTPSQQSGSFGRGLAGGLLGGALGGMLFGSMFGMGGSGMGILPLLLLGGVGYYLYRKFTQGARSGYSQQGGQFGGFPGQSPGPRPMNTDVMRDVPPPPPGSPMSVEEGFAEIRHNDPGFDPAYFKEIASDVFFQVQAGWMRRDLDSYRHLLGDQLAEEYAGHFDDMRKRGVINKLESIAIRGVEISDAGSTGTEDFVTVRFTANLLDYTVSDTTGELVEGSMTTPVKFAEEWTWARPLRTDDWKLEGIKVVNG
ncbi:Tim44 domain-containing protein [Desulfopila aestuarii]|uniref:Predicted lipid-binding transport protein, Tim44 family n=1 Tax=Desulfopila aestuarii DSM 18488 TaxID=1121416 RepID=A0A1M7Y5Z9_9BACT|nr:Tim44 domain-containing protein [Desulfopila aestuarii]SHO47923.1 Predicted lipid-binding transport protein, Tim44 family [Desulfopila aestuarii DSM 18488]